MSAGAARFAHARPRRSRIALALTIGVHLLAVWLWLQQRPSRPPRPAGTPDVVTILLRPAGAPRVSSPASEPAPASLSTQAAQQRPQTALMRDDSAERTRAVRLHDLPPIPYVPPVVPPVVPSAPSSSFPSSSESSPAAPAAAAQAPSADATDARAPASGANTPAAAASTGSGFTAGLGRRQAGRIDRELRAGKSGVPTQADTPWARFERGLEAAHVESSMSAHLDSYTAPDGVVIYRRRVGGRIVCYRTGSVSGGVDPALGALGTRGVNDAGSIPCPSTAQWKQEE